MLYRITACLFFAGALIAAAPNQLGIVNVTLHQFEDGPVIPPGHQFVPGETVFLSFQVNGYQQDEDRKISLQYKIEARDPEGVLLEPPAESKTQAEVFPEDKEWRPKMRLTVVIPPHAPGGAYKFLMSVKDEKSGSQVKGEAVFNVRASPVAPSDTLVVRNFHFYRTEDENAKPLSVAAYRPGDMVWARFAMTGYKLTGKNRLDVEYGISLLRATGEVMFSEPAAATEQDETFYPKRFLPGAFSVKLDPDIAEGEYTVLLSVRDKIGDQMYEEKQTFRVE